MSPKNRDLLDNVEISDDDKTMDPNKDPNSVDERELYKTWGLSTEEKQGAENRRLKKTFGSRQLKWKMIEDKTQYEKVEEFTNGAFSVVLWLRCKKDDKSIIVKKFKKVSNKEADIAKEVQMMNRVKKSKHTVDCLGFSVLDDNSFFKKGKKCYAIIMEYHA